MVHYQMNTYQSVVAVCVKHEQSSLFPSIFIVLADECSLFSLIIRGAPSHSSKYPTFLPPLNISLSIKSFFSRSRLLSSVIMNKDSMKTRSALDAAKRAAAYAAGEQHVRSGHKVGVGSGTTAKFFVEFLAESVKNGSLKDIVCVPSSFSTRKWLIDAGLRVSDLETTPELDLCIDGADEVDSHLNCIKGGGGCLTQEKIVQTSAKEFYIIADNSKQSEHLGDKNFPIPIEVIPFGYVPVTKWIMKQEDGEIELRINDKEKLGPVITDNNNFILDWKFPKGKYTSTKQLAALHSRLVSLPGVVETGLFIGNALKAYFATPDGRVTEKERTNPED